MAKYTLTSSRQDVVAGKTVQTRTTSAPAVRRLYPNRNESAEDINHHLLRGQQHTERVLNALRVGIFGSGRLITKISLLSGVPFNLYHGLGRPWLLCIPFSSYGVGWAGGYMTHVPKTDASFVILTAGVTGSFDFAVF